MVINISVDSEASNTFIDKSVKSRIRFTIFWKILLWFWLVFAVVFSINIFISQINSENARFRPVPPHLFEQLDKTKSRLESMFKKHPSANRKKRRFLRNAYLLDEQGIDYFGKQTPPLLVELNRKINIDGRPLTIFKKRFLYFGGINISDKGQDYRLYLSETYSIFSRGYLGFFLRDFAQNLLVSTLLVSFPLSFLLAWLFTRPIKRLQNAIKEMTNDLSFKQNLEQLSKRGDEFGDLASDFHKMASHLETIINSKNQLLGDVSHELRTPLARLQIAIGLANKKTQGTNSDELDRIKLEADRMNNMISSLLDYTRTDFGSLEANLTSFDLSLLIELVVKDIDFEATQQSLIIQKTLAPNLTMIGNQDSITSCLENILRNALRYAQKCIHIDCRSLKSSNELQIVITDDGPGVAEEQLEKIFEAFYRPQDDRSRTSGGAGLGLSIVKKVVALHEGSISARNIQPQGLEITIRFPISNP